MVSKKLLLKYDIVFVAVTVTMINIGLASLITDRLNEVLFEKVITDILVILVAGFSGKFIAFKVGLPLWWYRNKSESLTRQLGIIALLGLFVIIPNSLIYYFNQEYISTVPWLKFSSLKEVVLLALRAGLYEEILFRLFVFSGVIFLIKKITDSSQKQLVLGIVISSLLFGFMHGGINIQASILGGILTYTYYKNGLIPTITIHFMADVIPWTFLYHSLNL